MVPWEILIYLVYAAVITALYKVFDFTFLNVPWTPVALIGTAVAFMVGFQNNSTYGRIWEARMIWGAIVNTSRTWGMKVQDMVNNEYAKEPVTEEELKNVNIPPYCMVNRFALCDATTKVMGSF